MTRQDFVLIAQVISSLEDGTPKEQIAKKFAEALSRTNAQFDMARFMKAALGA